MLEKGLAYKRRAPVNWCPSCRTVLANEQVVDGACERCGTAVEQRELEQWFFRITDYADRLLAGLDGLTGWPDKVKAMQRNWIGRSEGGEIDFALDRAVRVAGSDHRLHDAARHHSRRDLPGARSRAPAGRDAHRRASGARGARDLDRKVRKTPRIEREGESSPKEGRFTGAMAMNRATGEAIPVWLANYVLPDYGTGAIMAVPAHDERDFEFARQEGLPVRLVYQPEAARFRRRS